MISFGSMMVEKAGACGVLWHSLVAIWRRGKYESYTSVPTKIQLGKPLTPCNQIIWRYLLLLTSLLRPLRIHQRSRVIVGQEADQVWRLLEGLEPLLDLLEQTIGDVFGQHHLAMGRRGGCWGRHGDWYNIVTQELGE